MEKKQISSEEGDEIFKDNEDDDVLQLPLLRKAHSATNSMINPSTSASSFNNNKNLMVEEETKGSNDTNNNYSNSRGSPV